MGKLVEATRVGYHGEARRRVGEQFIMADADFKRVVYDEEGNPKLDAKGEEVTEPYTPSWVEIVDEGYADPVKPKEAPRGKVAKKGVFAPMKRQPDDIRQGGAFDVHPQESGLQVTGQVAPAKPAASTAATMGPAPAKVEQQKSSGDKNVI